MSLEDRLHGALAGLAIGDAVGAPFEGRSRVARAEVEAWLGADASLRWTDDTHMALALARSLIENDGSVESQHLGETFAGAYAAEPWRGYGTGPPTVFAAAGRGVPYLEAATALFSGSGSFGNGAAMRVAPVAVVAAPDVARTAALAQQQALVTHAHAEAVDGAVLVAAAVCLLATTPACPRELSQALTRACGVVDAGPVRDAALELIAMGTSRDDVLRAASTIGTGVPARESVPAAVAAVLCGAELEGVLLTAVTLGGDTDTVAAMAGAMAGAAHGLSSIPGPLLDRLEARGEIERLGEDLLHLRRG